MPLSFPAHPQNWKSTSSPTRHHFPAILRTMAPSRPQALNREDNKSHPRMGMPTFVHVPDGRRNPFVKLWKFPPALQEEWPRGACKYMSLGLNKLHHYFYILRGAHVKGTRGMLCYLSCRQYMPRSHTVSVSSAQANWPAPRPLNGRGVPVPNILFSYCLMIKIAPAGRTAVNKNRKQPPD